MPQQQLKVMISSTSRDLPEHRKELVEACLRQDAFPLRMEDLPANSEEATTASLKMVEEADVYVGVFANRYGYVPKANNVGQISVTEMEYNRAVERKIPRLIFIMDRSHSITVDDVEIENAAKVEAFKDRVGTENIVRFFKSPVDLRAEAINSLSKLRQPNLTTFHYVSDIPEPPEAFIVHPYTLLQTPTLIGRQLELKLLTDWMTGKELKADGRKVTGNSVRIMNIVAIGGLGKSALTWKWFNDIAPQEITSLAGRMWWTFYESDASFENLISRALAYVTRAKLEEVQKIPSPEREVQLLSALDRESFLIVLDGLERILIAYARMDASRLDDSQVGKDKGLRKTADPRVGNFLRRLAQINNSRILVSTRLYPAELETDGGSPIPGGFRCDINGLTDEDAVELWRAFGVSGSRDELLPVFATFGKHPLLIQVLAGQVKRYRRAPASFQEWQKSNPRFDPARFPDLTEAMGHVLEFALRGLDKKVWRVLHTISAFRMPATYDTLTALLVGKGKARFELSTGKLITDEGKLFDEEARLDEALTDLEDRGLIGWDRRANRYDQHPIVRRVVWGGLGYDSRRGIYASLQEYFGGLPKINEDEVISLEDLTPAIELYNTLIGLERYDDALSVFYDRMKNATHYRLSASHQQIELLEALFADGLDKLPRLRRPDAQAFTLDALAQGYDFSGQPGRAASLYRRAIAIYTDHRSIAISLSNLSTALQISGSLRDSEAEALRTLRIAHETDDFSQEAVILQILGFLLAIRGMGSQSASALQRSLRIALAQSHGQGQGIINLDLAQQALWLGNFNIALSLADHAWELAQIESYEADVIRALRMKGEAALGLNDFVAADQGLHHALARARIVNRVEEELLALVALAELRRRNEDFKAARELLENVWESAERGPYPLFHADAFNVLAQIERDAGKIAAAVEAAMKAYRLAWCDGPPFAYHWGLEKAKQVLKELGAPDPEMLPFDESKFEPIPQLEIDPDDEFHVGNVSDSELR